MENIRVVTPATLQRHRSKRQRAKLLDQWDNELLDAYEEGGLVAAVAMVKGKNRIELTHQCVLDCRFVYYFLLLG